MLGDLNARVGNEEVLGVMGKYGVLGMNVSEERLLELCMQGDLVIGSAYIRKKGTYK